MGGESRGLLRTNIRLDFPVSDLRNRNIRLDFPFPNLCEGISVWIYLFPASEVGISIWIFLFRASAKEYPFGFSSFRASPLQYHFVNSFPASSVAVPSRGFTRCPGFAFHGSPLWRSHINIPTANIVIFPLIRARDIRNVPPKPQFLCFFINFMPLFRRKFVPLHPRFERVASFCCSILQSNLHLERDIRANLLFIGAVLHSAVSNHRIIGAVQGPTGDMDGACAFSCPHVSPSPPAA